MIKNIFEYIKDNNFKIIYENSNLSISNYKKIDNFTDSEIKLSTSNFIIIITGSNLTINRLYNEELLINGVIKNINFEGKNE